MIFWETGVSSKKTFFSFILSDFSTSNNKNKRYFLSLIHFLPVTNEFSNGFRLFSSFSALPIKSYIDKSVFHSILSFFCLLSSCLRFVHVSPNHECMLINSWNDRCVIMGLIITVIVEQAVGASQRTRNETRNRLASRSRSTHRHGQVLF